MDEDGFAGAKLRQGEQRLLRGEEHFGHGRGLRKAPARGDRHGHAGVEHCLFRIPASAYQTEHAVADVYVAYRGTDSLHLPGQLESENIRLARRRRIEPLPLQRVGAVQRSRSNANQKLIPTGNRVGDLSDLEHLRPAGFVEDDSSHGAASLTGPS